MTDPNLIASSPRPSTPRGETDDRRVSVGAKRLADLHEAFEQRDIYRAQATLAVEALIDLGHEDVAERILEDS